MTTSLFPNINRQDVGSWLPFTPLWNQGATNITWSGTCHYTWVGKQVVAWYDLTATSAGSAGAGIGVSLPVGSTIPRTADIMAVGTGFATVSTGQVPVNVVLNGGGALAFTRQDAIVSNYFGADPSFTIASGNRLGFFVVYESDTPSTAQVGGTPFSVFGGAPRPVPTFLSSTVATTKTLVQNEHLTASASNAAMTITLPSVALDGTTCSVMNVGSFLVTVAGVFETGSLGPYDATHHYLGSGQGATWMFRGYDSTWVPTNLVGYAPRRSSGPLQMGTTTSPNLYVTADLTLPTGFSTANSFTSGRAAMVPIWLNAGDPVTQLSMKSAGAYGTLTNQWMAILDSTKKVVAVTNDLLTAAWATNTRKTFTIASSPWICPRDGMYYFCGMVKAGSMGAMVNTNSLSPFVNGACFGATGLTTPSPIGTDLTGTPADSNIWYFEGN